MKKKIYRIISLTVTAALFASVLAYAENTISISVDTDTNTVTVSGNIEGCKGRAVSLIQLKPGVDESVLDSADSDSIMNYVDYADAVKTDGDGNYSFSYVNNGTDGTYTVRVAALDSNSIIEKEYLFSGYAVQQMKAEINKAKEDKDIQKMKTLLKNAYVAYDIKSDVYESVPAEINERYREAAAEILIALPGLLGRVSLFL